MAENQSNSENTTDKIEKENVTNESLNESAENLDATMEDLDETKEEEEEEEEEVLTLAEVIKEEQDLIDESVAVLGGSDEKCCTYNRGYVKRQALYACLTCNPVVLAGICLACSYYCHEGHELIELYTKRNFRCDCPTDRIEKKCSFELNVKTESGQFPLNSDNTYNQNFAGLYCICKRPYPDPEKKCQDDMIQCIICEDWYHSSHLNVEKSLLPKDTDYCEMTCPRCMKKVSFLQEYTGFAVNKFKDEENIEKIDVIGEKNENIIDEKKDTDMEIDKQKDSDVEIDKQKNSNVEIDKQKDSNMEIDKQKDSDVEIDKQKDNDVEIDKQKDSNMEIDKQKVSVVEIDKQKNSDVEIDKQKDSNMEIDKQKDSDLEIDKQKDNDVEIDKQKENNMEIDKQKDSDVEIDKQKDNNVEIDKQKDNDVEIDKQKDSNVEIDKQKDSDVEIDKQKDNDVEIDKQKDSDSNVDEKLKLDLDKSINDIMNIGKESTSTDQNQTTQSKEVKELNSITKKKLPTETDGDNEQEVVKAKQIKLSNGETICKRPNLINNYKKGAVFWPHDWRKQLCTCSACKILCFGKKVEFLLDNDDTAQSYAAKALKAAKKEPDEEEIITNLLTDSGLSHVQKINAVMGYNHLKDKLKEFLIPFVLSKRVVTSEDVNTFFEGLDKKKKSNKGEPSHFCR